jgi:hypothetical protein
LVDLRVWIRLAEPLFSAEPRFWKADVTELARPAAAPVTAEAAPEENPLPDG